MLDRISHLPTFLLICGLPVYWIELYFLNTGRGQTSPLAWLAFAAVVVMILLKRKSDSHHLGDRHPFESESIIREKIKGAAPFSLLKTTQYFVGPGILLAGIIVAVGFWASFFPPHLSQETDFINYHIMLPRQHLIQGSFDFIRWTVADLFLIPLDYAVAPFSLATQLPNKWPFFIFFVGMVLMAMSLTWQFSRKNLLSVMLVLFALLGSHNIGIQTGIAMFDVMMCYLFLAALDSLLNQRWVLFAVEVAFYFWSKSFLPVQISLIIVCMVLIYYILRWFKITAVSWDFQNPVAQSWIIEFKRQGKTIFGIFLVSSCVMAGPFLAKTLAHAGTPLYPFAVGSLMINRSIDPDSNHWQSLLRNAEYMVHDVKDDYGHGRSPVHFLKHLWLVAVPEKDVNNAFDYPLGLIYLLVLGPFIRNVFLSLRKREFAVLPLFVIVFWAAWWMGSQQSRFLFNPLLIMIITVFSSVSKPSIVLRGCLLLALAINAISVVRAHQPDFGRRPMDVLKKRDLEIVRMNEAYFSAGRTDAVEMNFHTVGYAQFPVVLTKEEFPLTLAP